MFHYVRIYLALTPCWFITGDASSIRGAHGPAEASLTPILTDQAMGTNGLTRIEASSDGHNRLGNGTDGRVLMAKDGLFHPLSCNKDPCARGISTWNKQKYDPEDGTVVIPCGKCVFMDFDLPKLVLPHGLDIQGRLTFPDGYKVIST